jgi:hypothetical protein
VEGRIDAAELEYRIEQAYAREAFHTDSSTDEELATYPEGSAARAASRNMIHMGRIL